MQRKPSPDTRVAGKKSKREEDKHPPASALRTRDPSRTAETFLNTKERLVLPPNQIGLALHAKQDTKFVCAFVPNLVKTLGHDFILPHGAPLTHRNTRPALVLGQDQALMTLLLPSPHVHLKVSLRMELASKAVHCFLFVNKHHLRSAHGGKVLMVLDHLHLRHLLFSATAKLNEENVDLRTHVQDSSLVASCTFAISVHTSEGERVFVDMRYPLRVSPRLLPVTYAPEEPAGAGENAMPPVFFLPASRPLGETDATPSIETELALTTDQTSPLFLDVRTPASVVKQQVMYGDILTSTLQPNTICIVKRIFPKAATGLPYVTFSGTLLCLKTAEDGSPDVTVTFAGWQRPDCFSMCRSLTDFFASLHKGVPVWCQPERGGRRVKATVLEDTVSKEPVHGNRSLVYVQEQEEPQRSYRISVTKISPRWAPQRHVFLGGRPEHEMKIKDVYLRQEQDVLYHLASGTTSQKLHWHWSCQLWGAPRAETTRQEARAVAREVPPAAAPMRAHGLCPGDVLAFRKKRQVCYMVHQLPLASELTMQLLNLTTGELERISLDEDEYDLLVPFALRKADVGMRALYMTMDPARGDIHVTVTERNKDQLHIKGQDTDLWVSEHLVRQNLAGCKEAVVITDEWPRTFVVEGFTSPTNNTDYELGYGPGTLPRFAHHAIVVPKDRNWQLVKQEEVKTILFTASPICSSSSSSSSIYNMPAVIPWKEGDVLRIKGEVRMLWKRATEPGQLHQLLDWNTHSICSVPNWSWDSKIECVLPFELRCVQEGERGVLLDKHYSQAALREDVQVTWTDGKTSRISTSADNVPAHHIFPFFRDNSYVRSAWPTDKDLLFTVANHSYDMKMYAIQDSTKTRHIERSALLLWPDREATKQAAFVRTFGCTKEQLDAKLAKDQPAGCKVCMDKPVQCAFLPCSHACVCTECATTLTTHADMTGHICPICRAPIQQVLPLYFS